MHKILLYAIGKKERKCYECVYEELIKNAKKYATIEVVDIFNKKINQAQNSGLAQESYTQALQPYLKSDYLNIALHPEAKELDSFEFANLFEEHSKIAFFIGGAYGFENSFLQQCTMRLSLSRLTMSHKIAKMVLLEQIFRALTIVHNHPYHK